MRFDIGTLDSGERSLPFGLLVFFCFLFFFFFLLLFIFHFHQTCVRATFSSVKGVSLVTGAAAFIDNV